MFFSPQFTDRTEAICIFRDSFKEAYAVIPEKALMALANTLSGSLHCLCVLS